MKHPRSKEDILKSLVIAIDGPAGSGKTTTARGVAHRLSLRHIDTGAMYRAVTWSVLDQGIDPTDESRVGGEAEKIDLSLTDGGVNGGRVWVGDVDVTNEIRSLEVTHNVSLVSSYPVVRKAMVRIQRELSGGEGVVLEGRDIGSVVLPWADVKVYLDASVDERARRRMKELDAKGIKKSIEEMREDINRRDRLDSSRAHSPLRIAVGAHSLDTTELSIEEQIEKVIGIAERTAEEHFARVVSPRGKNPFTAVPLYFDLSRRAILVIAKVVFGLRIVKKQTVEYAENYVFASNHRSNGDPLVVGCTIDRAINYLAKESLFRIPLVGWWIKKHMAIPTRRGVFDRSLMGQLVGLLRQGRSLLIFPEGRRVKEDALGEPRPGLGYLALNSDTPVVPVYIRGSRSFWGALFRRPRLTVIQGHPIRLPGPSRQAPSADECREFGRMVMAAIGALQDEIERVPR